MKDGVDSNAHTKGLTRTIGKFRHSFDTLRRRVLMFLSIVTTVMTHKIYIVATNDRDLKRRIRKIPGVPIMSVARGKYVIERLPDAPEK